MDWIDAAAKVGLPALGLIGGWLGAALKTGKRVSDLEAAVKKQKEDSENEIERLRKELGERKTDVDKMRESSHDFAKEAAFAKFIAENSLRWEEMQRSLGQLEGLLQGYQPQESPTERRRVILTTPRRPPNRRGPTD